MYIFITKDQIVTQAITQSGEQANKPKNAVALEPWRVKGLSILRIVFRLDMGC